VNSRALGLLPPPPLTERGWAARTYMRGPGPHAVHLASQGEEGSSPVLGTASCRRCLALRERNETKLEWTRPFDNNYTKLPCGGVVCGGNQNLVGLQIVVTV
jgi:hypothetical protein